MGRRIPECHPDRLHQAHGLCGPCYFQQYDANRAEKRKAEGRKNPSEYADNYRKPPLRPRTPPTCGHPDRKTRGFGMCNACYQKARREDRLPVLAPRAECHPDRPEQSKGLCYQCYGQKKYWGDPEKARAQASETRRKYARRLREELIKAYGGKCACPRCPETNPAFLTLEHVNGDGAEHRRKVGSHAYADLRRRGWPKEGYTLLCWNCNAMTRGGRICPHMVDLAPAWTNS